MSRFLRAACSVAGFEEGELGQPIDPEKLPSTVREQLWASVARRYQDAAATVSASQKSRQGSTLCVRK